VANKGIEDQ